MPTLSELLKAEGLDISPALEAKLPTLTEASDEVRNLVTTKNELHRWKQDNKPKLESFEADNLAAETKYQEELAAKEKLAIENNDFKTQLEIIQERETKLSDQVKATNARTLEATQAEHEMQVASMFDSEYSGKLLAKNFVKSALGEDGTVSTSYQLDGKSYDSLDEFKAEAVKVPDLASQMKAPKSKGAQSKGSHSGVVVGAEASAVDILYK